MQNIQNGWDSPPEDVILMKAQDPSEDIVSNKSKKNKITKGPMLQHEEKRKKRESEN